MVRNKDQSPEGFNNNRRGSQGENRLNDNSLSTRESRDDDQREIARKGNKASPRKGNPGKKQ